MRFCIDASNLVLLLNELESGGSRGATPRPGRPPPPPGPADRDGREALRLAEEAQERDRG